MQRCQHCDRDIIRHPSGHWLDSDGLWYCMRRYNDQPLAHAPMPVIR
jgi:hypothetical protein